MTKLIEKFNRWFDRVTGIEAIKKTNEECAELAKKYDDLQNQMNDLKIKYGIR